MVIDSAELIYISYYVGFATILRRVISRTYFIFVLQCFLFFLRRCVAMLVPFSLFIFLRNIFGAVDILFLAVDILFLGQYVFLFFGQ